MTDAIASLALDSQGFTIWTGGERPVPAETLVAVRVQGNIPRVVARARDWPQICWKHRPATDPKSIWNIIAFRIIE